MRFWSDQPDRLTPVQWYFVPDDRPGLGITYSFGSQIYDRDILAEADIGEVYNPHPYSKGAPPYDVPSTGFCGSPEQWENGSTVADTLPPLQPNTNVPCCCGPVPIWYQGGLALGGQSSRSHQVRSGGLALGGRSNRARLIVSGGLALGGRSQLYRINRYGSLALGGRSNRGNQIRSGGLAIGGRSTVGGILTVYGGLALGGYSVGRVSGLGRDGLAIGGKYSLEFDPSGSGRRGLAIGGRSVIESGPRPAGTGGLVIGGASQILIGGSGTRVAGTGGLAIGTLPARFAQGYGPQVPPIFVGAGVWQAQGGLGLGGASTVTTPIGPCSNCSAGTPTQMTVTISGFTGAYATLNNSFVIPHYSTCEWQQVFPAYLMGFDLTVQVFANPGAGTSFLSFGLASVGTAVWTWFPPSFPCTGSMPSFGWSNTSNTFPAGSGTLVPDVTGP